MTFLSQLTVAGVAAWYGRNADFSELWKAARVPLILSVLMLLFLLLVKMALPMLNVLIETFESLRVIFPEACFD